MRNLVILGGGTAGTMIANKLQKRLRDDGWVITVVDRDDEHHYPPGYPMPRRGLAASCAVGESFHVRASSGLGDGSCSSRPTRLGQRLAGCAG